MSATEHVEQLREVRRADGLGRTLRHQVATFAVRKPLGFASGVILVLLAGMALAAPWAAPLDPLAMDVANRLQPPSLDYLMGTDQWGRDMLSRIMYGAGVSLGVGFLTTAICFALSVVVGIGSAYLGSYAEHVLQRFVDAIMALPFLVIAMTILMVAGPGLFNVGLTLGIVFGVRNSRVVYSAARSIMESQYVEAARVIGCDWWRIIVFYMLPNTFAPLMVITTVIWGMAILVESQLSFLGMGVPPPLPSWGNMIGGAGEFMEQAPWMVIVPGVMISLAVFAFNMLGDALRDVIDPRQRGKE